jgi:hypothetical protein
MADNRISAGHESQTIALDRHIVNFRSAGAFPE